MISANYFFETFSIFCKTFDVCRNPSYCYKKIRRFIDINKKFEHGMKQILNIINQSVLMLNMNLIHMAQKIFKEKKTNLMNYSIEIHL